MFVVYSAVVLGYVFLYPNWLQKTVRCCEFAAIMLGNNSAASIAKFRSHMKTLQQFSDNALLMRASPMELASLIPMSVHADGAEMYRNDEFFIYSWSSAFAYGGIHSNCLVARFPIAIIAERQTDR